MNLLQKVGLVFWLRNGLFVEKVKLGILCSRYILWLFLFLGGGMLKEVDVIGVGMIFLSV
jgi:hypothetical protein